MKIIQFFSHAHPYIQTLFFTVLFLICWNIENFYGVTRNYKKFKTSSINFYFVLSGSFVQFIMGFLFVKILTLENIHQYGFSKLSNVTSYGYWHFINLFKLPVKLLFILIFVCRISWINICLIW